jgi:hypothetical protein
VAASKDTGRGRREERRDKGKIKQGEWRKEREIYRFLLFRAPVRKSFSRILFNEVRNKAVKKRAEEENKAS